MRPSALFKRISLHDSTIRNIEQFPDLGVLNIRVELMRSLQKDYLEEQSDEPLRGWLHFIQVKDFDSDPLFDSIDWSSMDGEVFGLYPVPERDQEDLQAFQLLMNINKHMDRTHPFYIMRFLCGDALWLPDSEDPGGASLLQILNIYLHYRESGFLTRGGLTFVPAAALSMLHDMAEVGVRCLGIAEWYLYTPEPPHWIVNLGAELNPLPSEFMPSISAKSSTETVAAFLQTKLPANTAYVALYFSYPAAWNKIINDIWNLIPGPTDPLGKEVLVPVSGDTGRFVQVLLAFLMVRDSGFPAGDTLVFTKDAALKLIDEMAKLGFACRSAAGYGEGNPPELSGETFRAPNDILNAPDAIQRSAAATRTFIESGMQAGSWFVSLNFDMPSEWQQVLGQAWQLTPGPTSALHLPPPKESADDNAIDT